MGKPARLPPDWAFDNANTNANVLLDSGYYDDFYTDLGWTVNSVGANVEGEWVRAVPIASFVGDNLSNPDTAMLRAIPAVPASLPATALG